MTKSEGHMYRYFKNHKNVAALIQLFSIFLFDQWFFYIIQSTLWRTLSHKNIKPLLTLTLAHWSKLHIRCSKAAVFQPPWLIIPIWLSMWTVRSQRLDCRCNILWVILSFLQAPVKLSAHLTMKRGLWLRNYLIR